MNRTVRTGITLALLAWLLHRIEWPTLLGLLADLPAWLLAGLTVLQLAGAGIAALKWRLLLPDKPGWLLLRLNLLCAFYGLLAPGQLVAEALKAYVLGRGRRDAEIVAASVIVDKLTGLSALLAVGLAGLCLTSRMQSGALLGAFAALLAACIAIVLAMRMPRMVRLAGAAADAVSVSFPVLSDVMARVKRVIASWRALLPDWRVLLASLALGAVLQAIHVATVAAIAARFAVELPLAEWAWILGAVSVVTLLPISIGGAGVREGAFVGILAIFGIRAETALAISFALFGLQLALGAIGAGIHFLDRHASRGAKR